MMKEELIKFVMERADREYSDDFPILKISDWINEFFNQIQPDRLNSGDHFAEAGKVICDSRDS